MWPFKKKEDEIWEKSVALITDTIDTITGRVIELYTGDKELAKRATEEIVLDIALESAILLVHVLDLILHSKRPDVREGITRSMYRVISGAYDTGDIDKREYLSIEHIIDDRMEHYSMIVRGEWAPTGYWWFGREMKQEPLIQCYTLFGDYITYFRECGELPIEDDIEPVILVNPLDCEALAVPFIVFQCLAPAVTAYIEKLQKIIR